MPSAVVDTHLAGAAEALAAVRAYVVAASMEPDPVARRREQVRIARQLRDVADALDDTGRLSQ